MLLPKWQADLAERKELKDQIIGACWVEDRKENSRKSLKVDWVPISLDEARTFKNVCS